MFWMLWYSVSINVTMAVCCWAHMTYCPVVGWRRMWGNLAATPTRYLPWVVLSCNEENIDARQRAQGLRWACCLIKKPTTLGSAKRVCR